MPGFRSSLGRFARRAATLALLGLLLAAPAAAQLREGLYTVEGQNPDGSTYEGQFALQAGPGASWLAGWQVADARILGLGVIQGGVLAVSFVVDGRPGVAAYEVEQDGRLRGIWSTGGGLGTELLTPR
jgi:hypothetical protein